MAAKSNNIVCLADTWNLLNDSDANTFTFQNLTGYDIYIQGNTSNNAPVSTAGAFLYKKDLGERAVAITDLFPGSNTYIRLFAFTKAAGNISVSYT